MKNVILILGILTTVMVFGVVAGVSDERGPGPDIDMIDVDPDDCRDCHKTNNVYEFKDTIYDNNKDMHHNIKEVDVGATCSDEDADCHTLPGREIDCTSTDCHHFVYDPKDGLYVDDHHDELDNTDCSKCHPVGEPKPL